MLQLSSSVSFLWPMKQAGDLHSSNTLNGQIITEYATFMAITCVPVQVIFSEVL
jgi:predicted MFS family arabinose efflux permease